MSLRKRVAGPTVLLLILGVIQVMSLFRTLPSPACGRIQNLGHHAHVLINCDSAVFMKDAQAPQRLINGQSVYQDRPLYAVSNWVLSNSLIKAGFPNRTIPIRGNSGSITQYSEIFYLGYLILNFLILFAASLLMLKWLKTQFEIPLKNSMLWLVCLNALLILTGNELTKTFFWTPHSQMFNILLPAYALYLFARRNELNTRKFELLNLGAIGALLFCYSLLGILYFIILFSSRRGLLARFRRIFVSIIPYAMWPFIIQLAGGKYHSIAITRYREYIWVFDSIKNGDFVSAFLHNESSFARTLPLFPASVLLIVFVVWAWQNRNTFVLKRLLNDLRLQFFITFLFFYSLMGYYARRVTLSPILFADLLAFAVVLKLLHRLSSRIQILLTTGFLVLQLIFWVFTHGPMQ